jgi:putative peptidoglycan lipid II flippase
MSLLKSAVTVGALTLVSRVLGFVRDVLIASILGSGPVAEAFVVAFRFPNLFRRLFGEGAFNSAFVPLFAKRMEGEGIDTARRFAEEVLSGLLVVVLLFFALAEFTMGLWMTVYVHGFTGDPAKFDLAVLLSRIAFPYLVFMSLVALLGGVLNSLHRFWAAAAAPILLNIVLIAALLGCIAAGTGNTAATGHVLAWGVALAGLAQFLMLWLACRRAGVALKLRRPRLTEGVRRLVALGVPGVIAGGITQLNLFLSTMFASPQDGANAWLYYADRIYQLPLGIVGVAIGVVLLPELSRRLRAGDDTGVAHSQNRACEFAMLITLPAAAGLIAMPYPIIQVLFERGAFAAVDTAKTAAALAAFGAGLPAFVLMKVFSPGFFAREDTRTPMYFALAGVGLNIVGAIALFPVLGHVGIAIATTLASWVNSALLGATLARRGHFTPDPQLRQNLRRTVLASLVMGAVVAGLDFWLRDRFIAETGFVPRLFLLLAMVGAAATIYFAMTWANGALDPGYFRRMVRR